VTRKKAAAEPRKKVAPAPSTAKKPKAAKRSRTSGILPSTPDVPVIRRARSEPPPAAEEALVETWARRGEALLRELAAHGAAEHEYRVDLKDGRVVWLDPCGRVSAEARAKAICSYTPAISAMTMAWADPLLRAASVRPVERMPAELDDLDEEEAWRVAIAAADRSGVEWLYRVAAPNTWYFLGLSGLSFQPMSASFTPGSPAGLVLSELEASRKAIRSRAEPASVVRERLVRLGGALLYESEYAYRSTDWVSRLSRTGKRMEQLAEKVPVTSFDAVAQGAATSEWLDVELVEALDEALRLLEDEWRLFA